MNDSLNSFEDPASVRAYIDRAPRTVPGYHDIHRMAYVLLDERIPLTARILVLGAGGGLEMKAFSDFRDEWTYEAVDPAAAMLDLAAKVLGDRQSRMRPHRGFITDAPPGPFDAACSFLTMHFLPPDERRSTAVEVKRRLSPGAPFVVMHLSLPQRTEDDRRSWINRHLAFVTASGIDTPQAERMREALSTQVPILTPDHDRMILEDAGFTDVTEFFSAFAFRGWIGYA